MSRYVYITGPLDGLSEVQHNAFQSFYHLLGDVCVSQGLEPYIPYRGNVLSSSRSDNLRIDRGNIKETDLLVAYVGVPSVDVGVELAWADAQRIPIVLLREKDASSPTLVLRSLVMVVKVISFSDFTNAVQQFDRWLTEEFTPHKRSDFLPPTGGAW